MIQDQLTNYRMQLDKLDQQLIKLLSRRMAISGHIGTIKKAANLPIYVRSREKIVLNSRTKSGLKLGLPANFIHAIFTLILRYSRLAQK